MRAIDENLDMQAVVDQENRGGRIRTAAIAAQLFWIPKSDRVAIPERSRQRALIDRIAANVGMRAGRERHGFIQETPRPGDHKLAACRIVALVLHGVRVERNGVGAIKGVVERAPSRIGGVEGVARITDRHDELWSGDRRDLLVDIGRIDFERRPFRHEIADIGKKRFVPGLIEELAAPPAIPVVDLCLQRVALLQQRAVAWREIMNDAIKPLPKRSGFNAGTRNDLVDDEVVENFGNLQAPNRYTLDFGHTVASVVTSHSVGRTEGKRLCLKRAPQSTGCRRASCAPTCTRLPGFMANAAQSGT